MTVHPSVEGSHPVSSGEFRELYEQLKTKAGWGTSDRPGGARQRDTRRGSCRRKRGPAGPNVRWPRP